MRTMGLLERMGISIGNNTVFVVEGLSATVKRFRNFGVLSHHPPYFMTSSSRCVHLIAPRIEVVGRLGRFRK
jgi:hypothetical protein